MLVRIIDAILHRRRPVRIEGMCGLGPPSYTEGDMDYDQLLTAAEAFRAAAQGALHCVHYSTARTILSSEIIRSWRTRLGDDEPVMAEFIHPVPEDTVQDPRNLWLRRVDWRGRVRVANEYEGAWDIGHLLDWNEQKDPTPVTGEELRRWTDLVIAHRSRNRRFDDAHALSSARPWVARTLEATVRRLPPGLESEKREELALALARGIPAEMLDRTYNLQRMLNHGVTMRDLRVYHSHQPFYDLGMAPPSHQQMADVIIARHGRRGQAENGPAALTS